MGVLVDVFEDNFEMAMDYLARPRAVHPAHPGLGRRPGEEPPLPR